jgi:cytochrome c551/c552
LAVVEKGCVRKHPESGDFGVWGEDIMPPQPHVSNEDAIALAKYILSLK